MEQGLLLSDWNSLENQLALVNAKGEIFMVNEAWQHDDVQHGMKSPHCLETSVGDDWSLYQDMTADKTAQTKVGIAAVLAGELKCFIATYSDSSVPRRSFAMTVTPVRVSQTTQGLLIARQVVNTGQQDEVAAKRTEPATTWPTLSL
jgi:uncharacterized protein YfiM (DUF2279 family)